MKKYFLLLSIILLSAYPTYGDNFPDFGVGPEDQITFKLIDSYTNHYINHILTETKQPDMMLRFGAALSIGEEYTLIIKSIANLTVNQPPTLIGDYNVDGETISENEVLEVHNTDWETFKSNRMEFFSFLENYPDFYNSSYEFIETDTRIGYRVNYSAWHIILDSNVTETNSLRIIYDRETGIQLENFIGLYTQTFDKNGNLNNRESVTEIGMVNYEKYEAKTERSNIPAPNLMSITAIITLTTLWQKKSRNTV